MGNLALAGATSGTITLTPAAVAGTTTITLPATTGTVVVSNSSGNASVSGDFTVGGTLTASGPLVPASSFKRNRIINGNMLIDQRNAGAAVGTSINGYTLDRWIIGQSTSGKLNGGQNYNSVTPPAGFTNYLGVQSQSAYSVGASDTYRFIQKIEGYNVADLAWGTADAKSVTLSFWVRSSLTGTFGGGIANSAFNRTYVFTYTINAANTWEYKTVTIAGDTTGTWLTTNGVGFDCNFSLGAGSTYSGTAGVWSSSGYLSATGATSVVGTNGATFYVTGVQLEVGTKATPYEMQIYSDQLTQCQRYFETQDWQQNSFRIAVVFSNNDYINMYQAFVVPKRTTPSVTWTGNGSGRWISSPGVATSSITVNTRFNATATGCSVSSTALYASYSFGWVDTLGTMQISAEL